MKRFQNEIVESKFALPLVSLYGLLVWIAAGLISRNLWLPFSLLALSVYVMAEINNRNALLRVRSRMVSCSFLMLTSMNILLLQDWKISLTMMCFVAFLFLILYICQDSGAVGIMFNAFIFIGVASIFWAPMLMLVPVLLLLCFRPLYGMSGRTFSAAILGVLVPYWLGSLYLIYIGDYGPLLDHITSLADTSYLFHYERVTIGMVVSYAMVVISMLIGMVHFISNSYRDKIRVRILFRLLMFLSLIFTALIAVAPTMSDRLMPMLVVTVSPLIAHFFTFTNSRLSNYTFIAWLVIAVSITILSLCLTSSYNMVLSECL